MVRYFRFIEIMQFHKIIGIEENAVRADKSAVGAVMIIDEIIGIWEHPKRADKSAVGAINRPLQVAGLHYHD
jgi:hypothetical protein